MKVRDALFKGLRGCTNHGCVIDPPEAGQMGTNGPCHCLRDMSHADWRRVEMRLKQIANYEIDAGETE